MKKVKFQWGRQKVIGEVKENPRKEFISVASLFSVQDMKKSNLNCQSR